MGFRLTFLGVLGFCALGCAGRVAAQDALDPAPIAGVGSDERAPVSTKGQIVDPSDPAPIIGVPLTPEPSPAPEPAAAPDQPPPAATMPAAPPPPVAAKPPAPPAHDAERPPAELTPTSGDWGFYARLSLGIGAALWINNGDLKLSKPVTLSVDLGYALNKRVVLIVRGSSWLRDGDLANEFLGAGAVYRFVQERLYVSTALGLSLTRAGSIDQWQHWAQGVAIEIDVGQSFALSTHTDFAVGAHFQFGTPWGGTGPDAFTSLHAGVFVSLGLR